MKKHIPPFLSGFLTAVLMLGLTASALAASGTITCNFSNIALRGERKITAGTTVTAQNGQQVPSSILYTDGAGGKTNYLPIRAISDLLGVEVSYDSATRTVHLDGRGAETREDWRWKRELEGSHVTYEADGTLQDFDQPPAWRPTILPEGWGLKSAVVMGEGTACDWYFRKDGDTLGFSCHHFSGAHVGWSLGSDENAAEAWSQAWVNGQSADFYQLKDRGLLVWEAADGALCQLEGPLARTELETIAASVKESTAPSLPACEVGWLPEGSGERDEDRLREAVSLGWKNKDGTTFGLVYTTLPLAEPEGTPETVRLQGILGRFWPGDPESGGGVTITIGSTRSSGQTVTKVPGEGEVSTLIWTDPDTEIAFRLQAVMDKADLLRMAESIRLK